LPGLHYGCNPGVINDSPRLPYWRWPGCSVQNPWI